MSKNIFRFASKHVQEILTGVGIGGMVLTVIFAVEETPKALDLIKEDSCKNHDGDPNAYTKKEAFKSAWKCYIFPTVLGFVSTACIVGATSIGIRRNVALSAAYAISEGALHEYKDQVKKVLGEKKSTQVEDAVSKSLIEKSEYDEKEVIRTQNGDHLVFDAWNGRYFRSDIEKIRQAINEANRQLLLDSYITMNELYWRLGLPSSSGGEILGWNIDDGLIEVSYKSQLSENGEPCIVMIFEVRPTILP